jgi:hypothetical protein
MNSMLLPRGYAYALRVNLACPQDLVILAPTSVHRQKRSRLHRQKRSRLDPRMQPQNGRANATRRRSYARMERGADGHPNLIFSPGSADRLSFCDPAHPQLTQEVPGGGSVSRMITLHGGIYRFHHAGCSCARVARFLQPERPNLGNSRVSPGSASTSTTRPRGGTRNASNSVGSKNSTNSANSAKQ